MWTFMLICDILTPAVMVATGIWMWLRPPKSINGFFGYRTSRSMSSREAWSFAHKYFGKLWFIIGLAILLPTVLPFIPLYGKDEISIAFWGLVIVALQMTALLVPIIPTEAALKKRFNSDGTEKSEN